MQTVLNCVINQVTHVPNNYFVSLKKNVMFLMCVTCFLSFHIAMYKSSSHFLGLDNF